MIRDDVATQVARLRAAFPNERMPEETFAVYIEQLGDVEAELLREAVSRVIAESRFFPRIAEVRIAAARLAGLLPPTPAEAVALVRRADVSETIMRRDGSVAYTEHFWRWPEDADPAHVAFCEDVLARVGDPVDHSGNGERHFGWDTGFQKTAEAEVQVREREAVADLSGARLLLLGSGQRKALSGGSGLAPRLISVETQPG